jgi:SAM-dependent methyltransferase
MPRTPGRVFADGDRGLAEAAVAALRAPGLEQDGEIAESFTHPFHSYPARLHPATARVLVDVVAGDAGAGAPVLDPFCGSGTVLVEAQALGLGAIGVDLNPLAVLVARAKTWLAPPPRRRALRDVGHAISGEVQAAGKAARRGGAEQAPERRPRGFDPNARNRRLAAWFAPHVRRELELIAGRLDELGTQDAELGGALTACLSAVLYKVSSRTSDTDDTWVARNVARGAAARQFAQRVDLLVAGLGDLAAGGSRPARVYERDARALGDAVPRGGVAGLVTSPPYAGTYDYAEHQRLRFDFLALRHRDLDAGEIGARRTFANGRAAEQAWRAALAEVLDSIAGALAPGRRAAIVIGDSFAGGRAHYGLDDVRGALGGDLVVEAWASQERPMLGGAEHRGFGDRVKAEHVIILRNVGRPGT